MGMIPHGTAFQLLPTVAMSLPMLVQPFSSFPKDSVTSFTSIRALACRCGPSLHRVMMSGPAPLSTAAADECAKRERGGGAGRQPDELAPADPAASPRLPHSFLVLHRSPSATE